MSLEVKRKLLTSALGRQVGSDPEVQVATGVPNHLTSAVMKYFGDSGSINMRPS
jgi:hypothetical protein